MAGRWLLLIALLPGPLRAEATLPEQRRGDVVVRTAVRVADPVTPGLAEVTLRVEVEGPGRIEAETRLNNTLSAWQITKTPATTVHDGRTSWTETVRLQQTKTGPAPLPGLKVRFRTSPAGPWDEPEQWTELLTPRDGPGPEGLSLPSTPAPWPWLASLSALALAVLLAAGWTWRRLTRRQPMELTPEQRALAALERLESQVETLPSAQVHSEVSLLVRGYLAERLTLRALQQTTPEFLQAIEKGQQLSSEQRGALQELLQSCDQARFAPVKVAPAECRQAIEQALLLVQQTGADADRLATA